MSTDLIEITGDIWKFHAKGKLTILTTNGVRNSRGECVMGAGIAKQAKVKFPYFPRVLGDHLVKYGNVVGIFPECGFITFPVKDHWADQADMDLIERSARDLHRLIATVDGFTNRLSETMGVWLDSSIPIVSVRPGCGNGGLKWADVKPVITPWFAPLDINIVNL